MPLILNGSTGISGSGGTTVFGTGTVTTTALADNAVTTSKIASSAITTDVLANSAVTTTKLANSAIQYVAPPASVAFLATTTVPSGWLKANGAAVSRTTYADLFAVIGTTYGSGDGSTTFNLPDLRGYFPRAWDDGRGIDSGRANGSTQGDAMRNITGNLFMQGNRQAVASADGVFAGSGSGQYAGVGGGGSLPTTVDFNASRQVPTASEFRPNNFALMAIIKF